MVAALIAAFAPVTFQGGTVTDLAKSIADSTNQSVLIAVLDSKAFDKFDYDPSDLNEMSRSIRAATKLRHAPGTDYVFHPQTLPDDIVRITPFDRMSSRPNFVLRTIPADAISSDSITWETARNEAFTVKELARSFNETKIEYHWTQEPYAMVANVKSLSTRDFLKYVGKAVGGILVPKKGGYEFQFNPEEFRLRARATLTSIIPEEIKKLSEMDRTSYDLALLAINSATVQQLREAFDTPELQTKIPMGPGQMALVRKRIEISTSPTDPNHAQQPTFPNRPRDPDSRIPENVDLRRGATLIFYSTFRTQVEVATVDQFGRPSGKVRY